MLMTNMALGERRKQNKGRVQKVRFGLLPTNILCWLFVCLFGLYGISTFVGSLKPNPFLYNKQFSFKQFSLAYSCQKHFYFKLFSLAKQF